MPLAYIQSEKLLLLEGRHVCHGGNVHVPRAFAEIIAPTETRRVRRSRACRLRISRRTDMFFGTPRVARYPARND